LFVQADRINFSIKRGEKVDSAFEETAKIQSINIFEYQILLFNLAKFMDPSNATSVPLPIFRPNMGQDLSSYFLSAIATQKAINQTNRLPTTSSEKAQALQLMCTELKSQNKADYVFEIRSCKKLRNFIIGYATDISIFEIEAELKQIDVSIKFDRMIDEDPSHSLHIPRGSDCVHALQPEESEVTKPPCGFCGGKANTSVHSEDSSLIGIETPQQLSEDFRKRMYEHWILNRKTSCDFKNPSRDISQFFKDRQNFFTDVTIPEYKNLLKYRFEANFSLVEFESFSDSFKDMKLLYEFFPQHTTGIPEEIDFDRLLPAIFRDTITSSSNAEYAAAVIPHHISDSVYIDVKLKPVDMSYYNSWNSRASTEYQPRRTRTQPVIDDEPKSCLAYIGSDISLIKEVLLPAESIKFVQLFHGRQVWLYDDKPLELVRAITLECESGPCKWNDTFYIVDEEDMPNFEIVLGKPSLESLKLWKFLLHFKNSDLHNISLQLP
jgi:hypothetical protein